MCGEIYFSFLNRTEPTLFLSSDEEVQKLHYFIKDFSVLTQLSARLSSLFVDQGKPFGFFFFVVAFTVCELF